MQMKRFQRLLRSLAASLAILALPALSGCGWKHFTVVIPDFDSSQVDGITVWRHDPVSDAFTQVGSIAFLAVEVIDGVERVRYEVESASVVEDATPISKLWRSTQNPDTVMIRMHYLNRSLPGAFKVSTFNAAGESPLSSESLFW